MRSRIKTRICSFLICMMMAIASLYGAASARGEEPRGDLSVEAQRRLAETLGATLRWFERTPPGERMAWGGLVACAVLGGFVALERTIRLRRRAVIPNDFLVRFLDRLHEGRLDGGKALDYCELHPSPAARVALAAVRRWGRPAADLERAVAMAQRWESERLQRNVGTLRRIATLAPLMGLLGSLLTADRLMRQAGAATFAPSALADALAPVTFGVGLGVVAMVLYDFLSARVEQLGSALDRLGAETIDAAAMTTAAAAPTLPAYPSTPHIRIGDAPQSKDRQPVVVVPVRSQAPRRFPDEPSLGA